MALVEMISLGGEASFFGAAFDPEKLPGYRAEVAGRVSVSAESGDAEHRRCTHQRPRRGAGERLLSLFIQG